MCGLSDSAARAGGGPVAISAASASNSSAGGAVSRSYAVARSIASDGIGMRGKSRIGMGGEELHQIGDSRDRDHRHGVIALEIFDGGPLRQVVSSPAAFHPVERDQHCDRLGSLATKQLDRLALGSAIGDHIIDDDCAAPQWCADDVAAFTVIFCFLPVVSEG